MNIRNAREWTSNARVHSADLREAFPDMRGFSSRNLKYMRAFAAAWPERAIVQEALAQKLRCYVIVELKAVPFGPAFIGQLNLYLSAADDLLRHPDDQPSKAAAVPRQEQARRRVRAASSAEPHRRRRLGDTARRQAPQGAAGQPADSGRDRGGAVGRREAGGETAQEKIMRRAGIARCGRQAAAELKGIGYGG